MDNYRQKFLQNVEKILDQADEVGVSNFTYDLFDCIYSDIVVTSITDFSKNTLEAYVNEIRNSLEIMNPELKNDVEMLDRMLTEMEKYLEIN